MIFTLIIYSFPHIWIAYYVTMLYLPGSSIIKHFEPKTAIQNQKQENYSTLSKPKHNESFFLQQSIIMDIYDLLVVYQCNKRKIYISPFYVILRAVSYLINQQIINKSKMGCTPSKSNKRDVRTLDRHDTRIGIFKVTVVQGQYYNAVKQFKTMKNPILTLQVSNQAFTTNASQNIQHHSKFNDTFNFVINSFYKGNGRYIQIQLRDFSHSTSSRAYGIADIDSYIKKEGETFQFKVVLNQNKHAIGHINLKGQFNEIDHQKLSFRFQNAAIRRRTNLIKDMNVSVRVTLGQEVLQTPKKKDVKQSPASWPESILQFIVPKNLKDGLIQVYDEENLIGSYEMNVQDLLKQDLGDQVLHVQQITFKNENAGTLKYSVMAGDKGVFSLLKDKVRSTIAVNRTKLQVQKT